ncbi:hypothetical protein SUGI_1045340 [Cryptomeria japonica]|nr:hypothetical protein SUGI_1045340 [Cryptomeria japonica]
MEFHVHVFMGTRRFDCNGLGDMDMYVKSGYLKICAQSVNSMVEDRGISFDQQEDEYRDKEERQYALAITLKKYSNGIDDLEMRASREACEDTEHSMQELDDSESS